jgi:hypothetical protein
MTVHAGALGARDDVPCGSEGLGPDRGLAPVLTLPQSAVRHAGNFSPVTSPGSALCASRSATA